MWFSIFHDGNSLQGDSGDVGPIPGANFAYLLMGMFCEDGSNEGVFRSSGQFSEFELTGAASPLALDTGVAIVHGRLVVSTTFTPIIVASPVGATRKDRLVLRYSTAGKTVRAVQLNGVEGDPSYPNLTKDETSWDIPFWKWSITTGGIITIAREYSIVRPRIEVTHEMMEIVERTIFVPPGSVFNVSTSTQIHGDMTIGYVCTDAHQVDCRAWCMCPSDLVGAPRIEAVVYHPTTAGVIYSALNWFGGKVGDALDAHQGGTGNQEVTVAAGIYDVGGTLDVGLADIEQGQIWFLNWIRQGHQGEDTFDDDIYFLGFRITYDGLYGQ